MSLRTVIGLVCILAGSTGWGDVIPLPAKVDGLEGRFSLNGKTVIIYSDAAAKEEAEMLASMLRPATGLPLGVAPMPALGGKLGNAICLTMDPGRESVFGKEGYEMEVLSTPMVRITAATPAGLFYGGQTLRQLLPPSIFAGMKQTAVKWEISCCWIEDKPRFPWRGFMLDSSRHLQPVEDIRRWLDLLAAHKLNVFHWHLVDDHGWRFESKKYPLLTKVGAWREQPPIGRYGGFYTQQEMRDIVAYAAKRHITVVPEIEMPGHSRAALAAYPRLACGGTKTVVDYFWNFPCPAQSFPPVPGSNVLCAGKEETYRFLEDVLTEVMDIFPSTFIHVGGDEVDMKFWNHCADCQAAMKTNHLEDSHKLQAHLMGRIEKFLNAHGRKLIGWDEIMEGGLSETAAVTSWRGVDGGIHAAKTGHDAVMSPGKPLYLDHGQSDHPSQPAHWPGKETLREIFEYDPVAGLNPEQAKHILGLQGNLWSCFTHTEELLEIQGFPRLCAVAERGWSPHDRTAFAGFEKRMVEHSLRLDAMKVNFWSEAGSFPIGDWSPNPAFKGGTSFVLRVEPVLAPGNWTVTYQYQKGADALTIDTVELLADDAVVAADVHEGTAGAQHIKNQYTLTLPVLKPGAKLVLRTKARVTPWAGGGNGDTAGKILLSQAVSVRTYAAELPLPAIHSTTAAAQDQPWWSARHQLVLQHNKTVHPDILIMGDSITHCWGGEPQSVYPARGGQAWKTAFGDHTVSNLGFSGDCTEHVLWRIDHGELDGITPKQVILLIGINNLGYGDRVADTVTGIDAVCRRIHEKLPDAKLLVLGILPCQDSARAAEVDKVNFLLQTRLHPRPYVDVLDLGNQFRKPDGTPDERLFSDGLHPNAAGYELLGAALALQINAKRIP